ncbi:MAG: ABC-F family ATP-binding cassette domain-containing protein [Planctomycetota bacterium]|nr:ABC-F family ATP-binding cassette domain-containing protein [Planctomycetota bacterium]
MPILAATNIAVRYGVDIILDGVSLSIEPGDRIGLVGRNGTGKSTLMKVLSGLLVPDAGNVSIQRGCRAGYLQQDPNLDPDETLKDAAERAFEELHALHAELHGVFDRMATASAAELDSLLKRQAELETRVEAAGGYAIEHRIEEVLHGLGFTDAQMSLKVKSLSGGQKGRLALARLLLESPDILLLDEPTNHLDIEGRIWLETFLRDEYRGAVVLVSHDRYLLDAVVTRIIETEQGRLIDYPGNYAKFRELRAQRREVMLRAYESQQTKFKKEEEFIRKYKAGQRAKQARGRETRLERAKEETLERPMELGTFSFNLPKAERTGDIVVSTRGVSKQYAHPQADPDDPSPEDSAPGGSRPAKVLFKDLDMSIERGERWGIIGPNGAGKTTLVRTLLGEVTPDEGVVRLGSNIKLGYYKQTHDGLPMDQSVYRYIQGVILKEAPKAALSEQAARDLAGAFLFSGDEQEKLLGMLSGGERSRAVLAGLLASAKNLIVLDEPTNHLDIPSAERLEQALSPDSGYDGTLVLISHDRALIDAVCDHLIVLDGKGGAELFAGNYTEWRRRADVKDAHAAQQAAQQKARADDAERQRRAAEERAKADQRTRAAAGDKLAKMKTEQIEKRIEELEKRIAEVDALLADPVVWRDHARSAKLSDERRRLAGEKEPLEFEWSRRAET